MDEKKIDKEKFRMPAEWEKHEATWLAWPNDDDYFEDKIKNIETIYLNIISLLHTGEKIKLLVSSQKEEEKVKKMMVDFGIDLSKITFFQASYIDVWIRDYGPTFIKNDKEKFWIKWRYDGYGGKFPELLPDNEVFLVLKDKMDFKMIQVDIALEGGAIETNGVGTLLTTEECLLENRNPGKSKQENNVFIAKLIGDTNVIWLKYGLLNDHTDGHIDELARFVSPTKILCAYEDDVNNEDYEVLEENYQILKNAVDQDGDKFEVIKLPMPHMNYKEGDKDHHGKQAPVSYANFYIGNETVLVSIFNDPNDEKALSIIESCFPNKKIVGIDCRDLIYGGGALHC
ncbi:MAG: agmatine deiminase family protein, partial [bacterium]